MANAQYLTSFTPDPDATLAEATDAVLELVRTDEFRRVHRIIEKELWSRPTLDEAAIDELLNERKNRWVPSV